MERETKTNYSMIKLAVYNNPGSPKFKNLMMLFGEGLAFAIARSKGLALHIEKACDTCRLIA